MEKSNVTPLVPKDKNNEQKDTERRIDISRITSFLLIFILFSIKFIII